MIDTAIYNEHINSEDLNTLLDKSSHVMINGCRVDSGGYVSNINSKVAILNTEFTDTTIVLRDSKENKIEGCIINNGVIKGVSIVQGYVYTPQVLLTSQNGLSTHTNHFIIND